MTHIVVGPGKTFSDSELAQLTATASPASFRTPHKSSTQRDGSTTPPRRRTVGSGDTKATPAHATGQATAQHVIETAHAVKVIDVGWLEAAIQTQQRANSAEYVPGSALQPSPVRAAQSIRYTHTYTHTHEHYKPLLQTGLPHVQYVTKNGTSLIQASKLR